MSETRDGMMTDPSPDEAAWVLQAFGHLRGDLDRRAPQFYRDLIDAMKYADAWSLERLSTGFPGLVTAHRWITTDLAGAGRLKTIARVKT